MSIQLNNLEEQVVKQALEDSIQSTELSFEYLNEQEFKEASDHNDCCISILNKIENKYINKTITNDNELEAYFNNCDVDYVSCILMELLNCKQNKSIKDLQIKIANTYINKQLTEDERNDQLDLLYKDLNDLLTSC